MQLPIYQIDAFTSEIFRGNPAAVCPLQEWLPDETLQAIAAENNLSETSYFIPTNEGFHLRWFTPVMEVDLCGHATLAAAYVIYKHLNYGEKIIRFSSKSGELKVTIDDKGWLTLDFPNRPPKKETENDLLRKALGGNPTSFHKSRDYLVTYATEAEVKALKPDFALLSQVDALGIVATAPGEEVDFVSRFFAPRAGINEDPVTGSAHCTLAPFWQEHLKKDKLKAKQISTRGGEVICKVAGDRVMISGQAVTYLQGNIFLTADD